MSISAIVANLSRVARAAGYREADYRRPIQDQPQAGADRCFQIDVQPVVDVFPRLAISDSIRTAAATVTVAYFRGGGDAGGQVAGGDILSVNCRAYDDMQALLHAFENDLGYDSQVTGIRRVTSPNGWKQSFTGPKFEVWELPLAVEWEQVQDVRSVA